MWKFEYWCITTSRSRQALANWAHIFGVVTAGGRPGQVEEVNLERVGQGGRVHVPVVQVQTAADAQHHVADLLPVPQLAHHLIDRQAGRLAGEVTGNCPSANG